MTIRSIKAEFNEQYGENKNVDRIYGFTMRPPLKMIVAVYNVEKAEKEIDFRFPIEFKQVEKPKKTRTKKK